MAKPTIPDLTEAFLSSQRRHAGDGYSEQATTASTFGLEQLRRGLETLGLMRDVEPLPPPEIRGSRRGITKLHVLAERDALAPSTNAALGDVPQTFCGFAMKLDPDVPEGEVHIVAGDGTRKRFKLVE